MEEYYLGKNVWSSNSADWKQRFEVGDAIIDPAGDWDPTTAEQYIDTQIGIEASTRLAQDTFLGNEINTIKKNKIYLTGTTLSQSQINQNNTIYVIKDNLTLTENITIPANCVLEFDGGSISSGTIVGQDTIILFSGGLIACVLDGTFCNNNIHVEWFGVKSGSTFDNHNSNIFASYIIPSMENIGNELFIESSTELYFSSPLVFNGTYDLNFKGKLYYTGSISSTAITIGRDFVHTPADIDITRDHKFIIEYLDTTVDDSSWYHDNIVEEFVGILVKNCKLNNFTFNNIYRFAYCLRLLGETACSSNKFQLKTIGGSYYKGIQLVATGVGFVNDNTFYNTYFFGGSGSILFRNTICIDIDSSQSTNRAEGNLFIKPILEDTGICMRLNNAYGNTCFAARVEDVAIKVFDIIDTGTKNNSILYTTISLGDVTIGEQVQCNKIASIESITRTPEIKINDTIGNGSYLIADATSFRLDDENYTKYIGYIIDVKDDDNYITIESNVMTRFVATPLDSNCDFMDITNEDVRDYIVGDSVVVNTSLFGKRIVSSTEQIYTFNVSLKRTSATKYFVGYRLGDNSTFINLYGKGFTIIELYRKISDGKYALMHPITSSMWKSIAGENRLTGYSLNIFSTIDLKGYTGRLSEYMSLYFHGTNLLINSDVSNPVTFNLRRANIYGCDFNMLSGTYGIDYYGIREGTSKWDTTNNKPLWWNGTDWVDATGTPV